MVKRNDGRRRRPQRKNKISKGSNINGVRRPRRIEAYKRQKFNDAKHIDIEYIEQEVDL